MESESQKASQNNENNQQIENQNKVENTQENKEEKFVAPKVTLPKIHFNVPKISLESIKLKLQEYNRVLKVAKKPDSTEFKTIVKASGLGMLIIGLIGFIIAIIVQLTGFK